MKLKIGIKDSFMSYSSSQKFISKYFEEENEIS